MMERYRNTMPSEVKDLWAKDAEARIAALEAGLREMRSISPDCDCAICLVLVRLLGEGEK